MVSCHKMNPTGGLGATMAMHDAVTLANWISTLKFAEVKDMEEVFKEYRAERRPVALEAYHSSQMFTKTVGKDMMSVIARACMKSIPFWIWRKVVNKGFAPRHQASFLPLVEDTGKLKPVYQPSLHKTFSIHKGRAENVSVVAAPVTV
ncbi:hypothetical protein BGZ59_007071 [Podila verticillata]|nr:hypothetical protein BGZ59_007071 [Podila verticillata]